MERLDLGPWPSAPVAPEGTAFYVRKFDGAAGGFFLSPERFDRRAWIPQQHRAVEFVGRAAAEAAAEEFGGYVELLPLPGR